MGDNLFIGSVFEEMCESCFCNNFYYFLATYKFKDLMLDAFRMTIKICSFYLDLILTFVLILNCK